jgi:carbon monoxide dehydrogenase subunit G
MKLESKTGKIPYSDERIFTFLSDFNNFKHLIPHDKIKGWQSDENSCRFTVDIIGEFGVKIIEKDPFRLIKLSGIDDNKYKLFFWVQLKQITAGETAIRFTIEADVNPMIQMIAKKPVEEFLDKLIDQLTKFEF